MEDSVCGVVCFTFPWKKQKFNKKSTNTIQPNREPALFFVYYCCLQPWLVALYSFNIILFELFFVLFIFQFSKFYLCNSGQIPNKL